MLSANLPDDIAKEIAVRLPVKSLLRFKSVSKSWYALITDPSFITQHLERSSDSNHRLHLIFRLHALTRKPCISLVSNQEPHASRDLDLPFLQKNVEYIFVYGQCNGIFCLYGVYRGDSNRPCSTCALGGGASMILWNPATKEVKVLPPSHRDLIDSIYVIFGFGIDPVTGDFKVVRFGNLAFEGREQPPVEVYNLSTDSWKIINAIVPAFRLCYPKCRTYLNGVYHWLTDDNNDKYILCFDFGSEVFGKIQMPPVMGYCETNVAVIDEKLACVATFYMVTHRFEIWVMNEYGNESSWSRRFNIAPSSEFGSFLGFWGDDEILVEEEGRLMAYHLGNRLVQRFEIHGVPRLFKVFGYVESLVPLAA
ncbi:F-box/kelch-repeat protein [Senna tora]|uniref:F-box/kelch-repeat protein n=1 Tax=Senna tora TaxID=362788 RepID=A0A834W2D6_9FABA|nr:F-box/kelch-repeat protein [Senna tora]